MPFKALVRGKGTTDVVVHETSCSKLMDDFYRGYVTVPSLHRMRYDDVREMLNEVYSEPVTEELRSAPGLRFCTCVNEAE